MVRQINNALLRADQIDWAEGRLDTHWLAPIVADAEAGFGGPLNAFEIMKAMIAAGASGVHFEDQLASEKKCGHMGGKVLVPTAQFIRTLTAARLAADVLDVPAVLIARTDALGATLLTSDVDPRDREFLTGGRTPEGYFVVAPGLRSAVARALAYAPFADLLWFESSRPDLEEPVASRRLCTASFPARSWLTTAPRPSTGSATSTMRRSPGSRAHSPRWATSSSSSPWRGFTRSMRRLFELAKGFAEHGMAAFVRLQEREFELETLGYTATRHQREVGAGYFDTVAEVIGGGASSTLALRGSTEEEQFSDLCAAPQCGGRTP